MCVLHQSLMMTANRASMDSWLVMENRCALKKPAPVLLYPPLMPYWVHWDWSLSFGLRNEVCARTLLHLWVSISGCSTHWRTMKGTTVEFAPQQENSRALSRLIWKVFSADILLIYWHAMRRKSVMSLVTFISDPGVLDFGEFRH
jgi:hypothetical protein